MLYSIRNPLKTKGFWVFVRKKPSVCRNVPLFLFCLFPRVISPHNKARLPLFSAISMSNHMCLWSVLLGLTDSRLGERREREGAREKDRERWWKSVSVVLQQSSTNPAEEDPPPARWASQRFFTSSLPPSALLLLHLLHNSLALSDPLLRF